MKQKILTYFYGLNEKECVHVIDKNIEEQLKDGWRAVSIAQSVYPTMKKDLKGETLNFNEMAVSVLYEKDE